MRNVRVFGSVLHGKDTEDSNLDLLVEPPPETTLMDIARIQVEVAKLLNISVDVLPPNALPDKFRAQVMIEVVMVRARPTLCASRITLSIFSKQSSASTATSLILTKSH